MVKLNWPLSDVTGLTSSWRLFFAPLQLTELIERLYGVRFSEVHVWRLLGAIGFSSQKHERRAIERDDLAVLEWKRKTWPALKKSVSPSDG